MKEGWFSFHIDVLNINVFLYGWNSMMYAHAMTCTMPRPKLAKLSAEGKLTKLEQQHCNFFIHIFMLTFESLELCQHFLSHWALFSVYSLSNLLDSLVDSGFQGMMLLHFASHSVKIMYFSTHGTCLRNPSLKISRG